MLTAAEVWDAANIFLAYHRLNFFVSGESFGSGGSIGEPYSSQRASVLGDGVLSTEAAEWKRRRGSGFLGGVARVSEEELVPPPSSGVCRSQELPEAESGVFSTSALQSVAKASVSSGSQKRS